MAADDQEDFSADLEELLLIGEHLQERLAALMALHEETNGSSSKFRRSKHVRSGMQKLSSKIAKEVKFVKRMVDGVDVANADKIKSSNLGVLGSTVRVLEEEGNLVDVQASFSGDSLTVMVDVVCDKEDLGRCWIKVRNINAKASHDLHTGKGRYGQKLPVEQARDFVRVAESNPHNYRRPAVVFIFACGISSVVASALEEEGIIVEGERFDMPVDVLASGSATSETADDLPHEHVEEHSWSNGTGLAEVFDPTTINLDVSTLLGYVSELCNCGQDALMVMEFDDPILQTQLEDERQGRLVDDLKELWTDKRLVACQAAVDEFLSIINAIGGEKERSRAQDLVERLEIVPDDMSDKFGALKETSKVKAQNKIVFGTGDSLKCCTTTANGKFIRAIKSQGCHVSVYVHAARALTELLSAGVPTPRSRLNA